jgi:hypothetical protein
MEARQAVASSPPLGAEPERAGSHAATVAPDEKQGQHRDQDYRWIKHPCSCRDKYMEGQNVDDDGAY